jgi:predicted ATPase/DNA-binding CsgD family transcriptional regulator
MRGALSDDNLPVGDLVTNMPRTRTRTENSLRAIVGGHGEGLETGPRGNVPLELTSFIGRERELAEIERLLGQARLLTLVGAGGSGKTRLALRAAARHQVAHGVWWVHLASLSDPELVARRIASALGVAEAPGRTSTELIVEYLEPRETLLVLDNCEHLVEGCAELSYTMLSTCPDLRLLATSREPLGVAGEVSWPVPPLSLPGLRHAPEDLLRCEAVRLFVERANAVVPGFALSENNVSAVAGLCAGLDGMPLAIELAASRTRTLSPGQILERLDDRLRLLTGGRTAVPRHRTLAATIDWSHDLLSEREKVLLRRLSVFAGGWTLLAAEGVCAGDGIREDEVLDALSGLVDKSLVAVARGDGETRYRMLETVRQYASDKLEESSEQTALRARHADFLLDLAEEAETGLTGPEQASWLERLETEHDNISVALTWLMEKGEAERGLRLAAALLRFWWFRGHLIEGRARLGSLLSLTGPLVRDRVRAKALHALAVLIYRQADDAAGDWSVARSLLEESLAIYRRLEYEVRMAAVLQDLGRVCAELGEWTAAHTFLTESLEIGRRLGDEEGVALSLFALGRVCWLRGDNSSARPFIENSLRILRKVGDRFWINACLVYLGYIDCEEGNYKAARSRFLLMNEILPLIQFPWGTTYTLEGFARLAVAEGEFVRALRLGGATGALRRTYGVSIGPGSETFFERSLEPAWQALDEEDGRVAWGEGQKMTLEEALDLALGETKPDRPPQNLLSARETEVLSLVAEGLPDAEVAETLYVSPRTVGGHLRSAYRKLGVKSRTAAVRKAGELGLI